MLLTAAALLVKAHWDITWSKTRASFEAKKNGYYFSFNMSDDGKALIASNILEEKATDNDVEGFLETIGMLSV